MTASLIAVALIAYFLGGLPFGYWFVRYRLGKDIRTLGSGNIGATNVQRTAGSKAGIVVLLLDIAKGLLAVWIAAMLTRNLPLGLAVAAVAVMLGHCYPVLLKFKGGKAVACFVGAFLYIAPLPLLAAVPVFVITVWWSRHVSLGSIVGAIVFPLFVFLLQHPAPPIQVASVVASVLIVYRHKANIARLRQGTEGVFSFKGSGR
ncbi:MAG TPA: glycerol-3-phosphate 1-O-acyltransferase PlsY [Bryobacteraceae bacterium]|nr:glycerol-3-phosphate 1-O-acyltransferase PlsY [Bryobacteraceae bacterium]